MILSNKGILHAIRKKRILIEGLTGHENPKDKPFNTSAVDLRLHNEIAVPLKATVALDLSEPGIADFLSNNSTWREFSKDNPYVLKPNHFILARTLETVNFPILKSYPRYSARVEGKSSYARCGILVHFTAPTIHAGFSGTIVLEIINFGPNKILLYPDMYICQLIIEEVKGSIAEKQSQFHGQTDAVGKKKKSSH